MKSVTLKERLPDSPRPHRHCLPKFNRTSSHVIVRRLHAAIENHNWRQNPFATEMRLQKGQRLAIRSEARETLTAVCKVIAYYTDYAVDSAHQFECWASPSYIAKQSNAMYLVDDSSVRYDTVNHALEKLEDMQAIHIERSYDKATKRNKPNKIYVMPVFFRMFSFNDKEISALIKANKEFLRKIPADAKSKLSHMWVGQRPGESVKTLIRGKAAAKKVEWMRKKFNPKAANDHAAMTLIKGQVAIARPDGGGRHKATSSCETMASAKLRDGLSYAEIWRIRDEVAKNTGCSGVALERAIDDYLRNRLLN